MDAPDETSELLGVGDLRNLSRELTIRVRPLNWQKPSSLLPRAGREDRVQRAELGQLAHFPDGILQIERIAASGDPGTGPAF